MESAEQMTRAYLAAIGRRKPVLRIPLPRRVAADFRAGGHLLSGDGVRGERTFAEYLSTRIGPDGSVAPPYELRGRFRRR